MTSVLVTGATGTLGRAVVGALLTGGHAARVFSRRAPTGLPAAVEWVMGDLSQGVNLDTALSGVAAIIHCASDPDHATAADVEGTQRLLEAARAAQASAPLLIYPSIVGIDSSPYGYYEAKRAAEALIERGPLPWTILRATQFHDLVLWLLRSFGADTRDEIVIPDRMRFQSVDVEEVAARLVSSVECGPAGRAPDLGGPEVLTFEEMAAAYLRIRGHSATILTEPSAGALYDVFRSGVNLAPTTAPVSARGVVTWDAWLRRRFSAGGVGA
jgi:uncharacterized protein YbjT (DUF2867 family)